MVLPKKRLMYNLARQTYSDYLHERATRDQVHTGDHERSQKGRQCL